MKYEIFLENCITIGIMKSKQQYTDIKLQGFLDGFNSCKSKNPYQLRESLKLARITTRKAFKQKNNYWYYRSYELAIEWICRNIGYTYPTSGLRSIVSEIETIGI